MKKTVTIYLREYQHEVQGLRNHNLTLYGEDAPGIPDHVIASVQVDVEFTDIKTWQEAEAELKQKQAELLRGRIADMEAELVELEGKA